MLGMAASFAFAPKMSAEDVYIPTNDTNPDCIIERGGQFDMVHKLIGHTAPGTSSGTLVELGTVDFGDGDTYKATYIDFANGWFTDGWAILWAGSDWEDALPFTQMEINEYRSYYVPRRFAANMGYNVYENGVSESIYLGDEPIQYVKPTGQKKVYLTFEGGNGNIFGIGFHEAEYAEEDFVGEENGWDGYNGDIGIRLRYPMEDPRYDDKSEYFDADVFTPLVPVGEDTEHPDTRIDDNLAEEGGWLHHWGWTFDGLQLGTQVDFGDNRFQQIMFFVKWGNTNLNNFLEAYIDDANNEANMIARVWVGREMDNTYYPLAVNLLKEVSGVHQLIVKWVTPGSQCDLRGIGLYEGTPWMEASECGVSVVDELPLDDAFHFTYVGTPEGQGDPWAYEIKARGVWESAGNVGYTGPGTVISFYMPDGSPINFGDSEDDAYTHIVVNHSAETSWAGDISVANFSFYLDLDPNYNIPADEWTGNLEGILEGHEPVAVVRLQGTGAWGISKHVRGEFTQKVTGEHDLYMVYNSPEDNIGANVFDIYFEHNPGLAGIKSVSKDNNSSVKVYSANGSICVSTLDSTEVVVYHINGAKVANESFNVAGTYAMPVPVGLYVVKCVDADKKVKVSKVIVK